MMVDNVILNDTFKGKLISISKKSEQSILIPIMVLLLSLLLLFPNHVSFIALFSFLYSIYLLYKTKEIIKIREDELHVIKQCHMEVHEELTRIEREEELIKIKADKEKIIKINVENEDERPNESDIPKIETLEQRFPENKEFNIDNMRFNNFQNLTSISFDEDVLPKLTLGHQRIFLEYSLALKKSIAELNLDEKTMLLQNPDKFTMLRFLQADDYNKDDAVKRMINCILWRMEFRLDDFITNPNQKLMARYRQLRIRKVVGFDKRGWPCVFERLGEFISSEESFKGGLSMDQWLMGYAYDVSEIMAAFYETSQKNKRIIHRINYVADLNGATLSGGFRLIPVLKIMTKAIEGNFPEVAGNLVLVNAPASAGIAWSIIRKFLHPKTASKISILVGPSPDVLRELCGPHVLPIEYGGTNPISVPHPRQKIDADFEEKYPL